MKLQDLYFARSRRSYNIKTTSFDNVQFYNETGPELYPKA